MSNKPVKLFYSYSHADEQHRENMEKFLNVAKKSSYLKDWHDRKILPGQKLNNVIKKQIEISDIVVFLVSVDFLSSDACIEEWELAKELANSGDLRLISVIVRPCPWMDFDDMKEYLVLPTDGKPITTWEDPDEVWSSVFYEIKEVISDIRNTFIIKDEFREDLSHIEFCTNSEIDIDISDVFVFPNLVTFPDGREDPLTVPSSEKLLEHKKSLIHGESHSGKSKLCSHLALELWYQERKAIYVDLADIASKKPGKKVFEECFSKQCSGDFDLWLLQEDKTVIFDNLTHTGGCVNHIEEAEEYFDRIVASVSEDDYKSYFSDDIRFSSYTSIAIRPFTHVKQEKLIKKWISARRGSAKDSLEHGEIDQIENNINAIIIDNRIVPRFPFFILSILQTYEGFMPRNLEISAYGHCYHALILANLIKSGVDRRDDSIATCMNYASHLAYEIMIKGDPNKRKLSREALENFNMKYKERFLIEKSLLNRLKGKYGLLRIEEDGSCIFSLPYSYYYFIGMYLAGNYKDNESHVVSMVENSHKKNNALSIIFTVHHCSGTEVLDEVMTHTVCAIDNVLPATLEQRETSLFYDFIAEIPDKLEGSGDVSKEREKQREARDGAEEATEVDQEEESQASIVNQVYQCNKNMEILSQILKNKAGSLEKNKIEEIVEAICDAGLRLAKILLCSRQELDDLVEFVWARQAEEQDEGRRDKLSDVKKMVLFKVFIWVMTNIEKSVHCINKPEIRTIIEALSKKKDTPAYQLIYYFFLLDTGKSFDLSRKAHLERLIDQSRSHKDIFIPRILSLRTQMYLNTHEVKTSIQQSVCSTLGVQYRPRIKR